MFIIQHVGNEQHSPVIGNVVYLIDVYDNSTLSRVPREVYSDLTDIFLSPNVFQFDSERELTVFLELDDPSIKGVVLHPDTSAIEDDHIYYILTAAYARIIQTNVINDRSLFHKRAQTPIYTPFQNRQLEFNTNHNVGVIHELYVRKYINRENVITFPEHNRFLEPIHSYFRRNDRRRIGEGMAIINRYVVENLMYVVDESFGSKLFTGTTPNYHVPN
jgi:hypothetical protein